ncbi:MAG: LysR family transcriptional regulator [Bacilli bacterium]
MTELRRLEYFVAVAQELHFGRAAARLQMTQPPLSQQIQLLEEELGVRLLERTKRRVQLTMPGEVYLREILPVLAGIQTAAEAAQRAQKGEVGRLTVGFVGSATYDILPALIREYRSRFPGVSVSLQELSTPSQEAALRKGSIDLGLVRPPVSDDTLAVHVIQESPCVLALPAFHELLAREQIRLQDLAKSPFVLLSRQTWAGLYDEILGLCHQVGFNPLIRQEAFEFQTVIGLVAAGLGVAVVPPSAQNLHTRDVVYRQVAGLMPSAAMGIAWRRDDASPLVREFIDLAKQTVVS